MTWYRIDKVNPADPEAVPVEHVEEVVAKYYYQDVALVMASGRATSPFTYYYEEVEEA